MNLIQLEQKISAANLAFSQNMPIYTDTEYDILWQKLFSLDPENPILYHTTNNANYANLSMHKYQIFGTQKAFNTDDLRPFLTRFGSDVLILEPKYDGCAAIFYQGQDIYSNKLILSGDGIKGQDVSKYYPHILKYNAPKAIDSGELVISWEKWKEDFGANPRNVVSGWMQRDNLDLHLNNKIEFVLHNNGYLRKEYLFNGNFDQLNEKLLSCYHQWSKLYPIDGIMIKVFDEEKRLITGHNNSFYHWSIAWKPPMQTKKTIVTEIIWNTSRSGRVVPTICYEPISLCSTTNSKATGNNAKWLVDRGIKVGSEIIVGKAGEIIPKILEVLNTVQKHPSEEQNHRLPLVDGSTGVAVPDSVLHPLNTPKNTCPTCEFPLSWKGVDLICTSDRCIAQMIKKLEYFYSDKGMELKSVGEFMLGDLLEDPLAYSILTKSPYALLDPRQFNFLPLLKSLWGEKRTKIYLDNLSTLAKSPIHFISALGYDKLAYKSVLKLWYFVFENQELKGVSKIAQKNFGEGYLVYTEAKEILVNFKFLPPPPIPKIIYCITGKLSVSRSEMINYLDKYCWSFSNQVSKYVDILIVGDEPGRTKTRKAEELKERGFDILTINEDQISERTN